MDDHHVAGADQRAEAAAARGDGVTITLGTPSGRPIIALAPSTAPSAPPSVSDRVELPVAISLERQPPQARQHAVHGLTAAARRPQRLDRRPAEPRDFRARDVRDDVERPAENAGVGDDRPQAQRLEPVADVGDLRALGIERADEEDRLHYMCFRSVLIVSSTSQV